MPSATPADSVRRSRFVRPLERLRIEAIQTARREVPSVYEALIEYDSLYLNAHALLDAKEKELQRCVEAGQSVVTQLTAMRGRCEQLEGQVETLRRSLHEAHVEAERRTPPASRWTPPPQPSRSSSPALEVDIAACVALCGTILRETDVVSRTSSRHPSPSLTSMAGPPTTATLRSLLNDVHQRTLILRGRVASLEDGDLQRENRVIEERGSRQTLEAQCDAFESENLQLRASVDSLRRQVSQLREQMELLGPWEGRGSAGTLRVTHGHSAQRRDVVSTRVETESQRTLVIGEADSVDIEGVGQRPRTTRVSPPAISPEKRALSPTQTPPPCTSDFSHAHSRGSEVVETYRAEVQRLRHEKRESEARHRRQVEDLQERVLELEASNVHVEALQQLEADYDRLRQDLAEAQAIHIGQQQRIAIMEAATHHEESTSQRQGKRVLRAVAGLAQLRMSLEATERQVSRPRGGLFGKDFESFGPALSTFVQSILNPLRVAIAELHAEDSVDGAGKSVDVSLTLQPMLDAMAEVEGTVRHAQRNAAHVAELSQKIARLEHDVAASEAARTQIEHSYTVLEAELHAVQDAADAHSEVSALRDQMTTEQRRAHDSQRSMAAEMANLRIALSSHQHQLQQEVHLSGVLRKANDECVEQIAALSRDVADRDRRNDDLMGLLQLARQELANAQAILRDVDSTRGGEVDAIRQSLEEQLAESKRAAMAAKQELLEGQQSASAGRQQMSILRAANEELSAHLSNERSRRNEDTRAWERERAAVEGRMQALEQENAALENTVSTLEGRLARLEAERLPMHEKLRHALHTSSSTPRAH